MLPVAHCPLPTGEDAKLHSTPLFSNGVVNLHTERSELLCRGKLAPWDVDPPRLGQACISEETG
ncbi:GL11717 [Drosophila persimilis]|uniref:GL11717 n=1 Tax=Drosophila persimilis TaxID=7234 RepID=B4GD90_DROPE|nr:GL11717 [Drosophila persimilis]